MEFQNIHSGGLKAVKLREDDDLIFVGVVTSEDDELFMATKFGYSVRTKVSEFRSMSRNATGVKGITLRHGDSVVSGLLIKNEDEEMILTVTENGFGKRTRVNEYPLQGRGGKGVINFKCSDKTGNIVEVKPVRDDEELMAITSSGVVIRTPIESVSIYGRATPVSYTHLTLPTNSRV